MKIKIIENAVLIGKCVVLSIKTSYKAIRDHPFLVVLVLFSYLLHNFHPHVFSFLLNASPVIICTTLLLGLLLSYGEPLIPEIEDEEEKTDCDLSKLQVHDIRNNFVIRRDDKLLLKSHNREYANGDYSESSRKVQASKDVIAIPEVGLHFVHSSLEYDQVRDFTMLSDFKKVDREAVGTGTSSVLEEHQLKLHVERKAMAERTVLGAEGLQKEQLNDDAHKVDGCVECASGLFADHSLKINGVRMDFDEMNPGTSCYSHLHSKRNRLAELADFSDSNSNGAESSSPDASMAGIHPMLDEFHPLLDSELSRPVHISIDDSDDTSAESSEDQGEYYSSEEEVAENQEDKVHGEGEENSQAMMAWTAKNVMDLGISEHEKNLVLERLMAKQNARRNAEVGNLMYLGHGQSVSQMGRYTGLQISPISTRRMDPFDHPNDSNENKGLPPIPSSSPSVLLRRRNPFEFPLPRADDSNIITVDWPIHRKFPGQDLMSHGYISGGPFSADNSPPNFLQEKSTSDKTSYAAFRKQLSEMSDSKLSSISESEILSSIVDQEYQEGLVEHDHGQENEVTKPAEVDNIGTEEIKCEELPVSYAPQSGFYEGECGETAFCISEVADEDLDTAAKNKSSSTLEVAVSLQYALLRKSANERDERSHAESISYSGFPPLGTSTADDDTLLEPLLSPDKGNLQQNFETFARQRSSNQVIFQIQESMEDDSDDDDSAHLAHDEAKLSALDGKAFLLTEGDVVLVAERTMDEFVIPGYYGESQKVQKFSSDLEMDKSRTTDEQPKASTGSERLEYPKVPAADPSQEQLTFSKESTGVDDNENMENFMDMHPDDDAALFPAAFTKDDGFIGIYTTRPVKDSDPFTFSEGQAETLMVDSVTTLAKSEDDDLTQPQRNGLVGDSQGICAGNNDLRVRESVSSGLDAVGDYIVEKSSSDESRITDEQPKASVGLERLEYPKVPAADPSQEQLTFSKESTDGVDDNENMEKLMDMHSDDDSAIFPAAFTIDDGFIGIYTTHPVKDLDSFTFSEGHAETLMVDSITTLAKSEVDDLNQPQRIGLVGDYQGICAGNNDLRGRESVSSGLDAVGDYIVEKSSSDRTQNDQVSQLRSNSEEEVLINNVTSEPDAYIISEDKTCLESTISHSNLPEVEAQSVEDLHVLKQLTEAGIDSPKNLNELSSHKIAGKESDTSHHSLESSQVDLKLVDVQLDPHEVKLQSANDLDAALGNSGSSSTDHIGEKKHQDSEAPLTENLHFSSKNEDEQVAEGPQPEKLDLCSDLHEIEAKSHEDVHLAFKRLSEEIADNDVKISESEPYQVQMEQKMEIPSDVHEVEVHSSAETLQKDSDSCTSAGNMMPNEESESNLHEVEAQSLEDIHLALKRLFRQSTFKSGCESKDTSIELGESENQLQPKLQYVTCEIEPQTPRDLDLALKRLFRQNTLILDRENESEDTSKEIGEGEKLVESNMEMETNFHEVEAQTLEDIHSAVKQFIRQNTIVLNDQTEEFPSELGEGDGLLEPDLEKHSDMHDVEAKSYDDLHSSLKQLSDGAVESSEKEFEFEDASSDFDRTERHVESDEEIYSVMHEAEAKSLDDTSSEQLSEGTVDIPDRVDGIDMSFDIVTAENESADSATSTN